jgi:hypothetical protein
MSLEPQTVENNRKSYNPKSRRREALAFLRHFEFGLLFVHSDQGPDIIKTIRFESKNLIAAIHEGTPSYTNPFSALLLLLFLTLRFPAAFTNIVKAVTTSTIIAATVGTYTSLEFLSKLETMLTYQDHLLFQIIPL